jgi:SAM-dependent methyltransferase
MAKATRWLKGFFREEIFSPGLPEAVEQAPREVAFVVRQLKLRKGQRVLDLCCGTGRHSFELARRGLTVTGLDATASYLARAEREAKGRENPSFILGDMRRLRFRAEFDAVINLWTSFGYFEDPNDDLRALLGVERALKPGGLFLVELINARWTRRNRKQVDWTHRSDGTKVLEEAVLREDKDPGVLNTWTVMKPGKPPERVRFFVRAYDDERLGAVMRQAGLRLLRVWGGLNGERYSADSKCLVALARKSL